MMRGAITYSFTFALFLLIIGTLEAEGSKGKQTEEEDRCICIMLYDPVCGVNHKTYSNSCFAACEGVDIAKKGPCSEKSTMKTPSCDCDETLDVVCGADGKDYLSPCEARCAGVQTLYPYAPPSIAELNLSSQNGYYLHPIPELA
eukprot:Rmarinus@m.30206